MATAATLQPLIQQGLAALGADVPTAQSLMRLAVALAQDVNRMPGLKGRERLEIVIKILREVLATPAIATRIPAEVKPVLDNVVEQIIPETLTLVVGASRGEFSLQRPSVGCVARLGALFCQTAAAVVGTGAGGQALAQAASVSAAVAAVAAQQPAPASTPAIGSLEIRQPVAPTEPVKI
jgi:hypothetical protein